MTRYGLFVGLITLDLIYLTTDLPTHNEKIVALDYTVAAGGPATNAAVTFSDLGNSATVLGSLGCHPISTLVAADLQQCQVTIADLNPTQTDPPPTSSILVTQATGERAVISINAVKAQASTAAIPEGILQNISVILIDGHQMDVGRAIAQQAKAAQIPIVIDGGSWKPGFEQVLPFADYVICSANFYPPDCHTTAEVLAYLADLQIPYIAITQGHQPIQFLTQGQAGHLPVPTIQAIDTVGAGDILHGAFCHYILNSTFQDALMQSAAIASQSCQFFGTRQWMQERRKMKTEE